MTMSDILGTPSSSSSTQPTGLRRKPSLSVMSSSLSFSQINTASREKKDFPSISSSYDSGRDNNKEKEDNAVMTASLIQDKYEQEKFSRAKSPFMGLLASRVSCVDCGYTDLERKIEQGRRSLAEAEKRQVTSDGTHSRAENDRRADQSEVSSDYTHTNGSRSVRRGSSPGTAAKTKISLEDMEKLKEKVDQCLANNIEMDLSPLELTPVRSKKTTKHSMIAKPPQALCLHLNRSMFTASGQMAKNPCRVIFGDRLDFTRFTTSGHLTTVATKSMSRRGSISGVNINGEADSSSSSRFELGLGVGMGLGAGGGAGTTSMFPRRG
ncbi:hypothetical protein BGX26_001552, partial [Mortierella sp. AD094]